MNAPQYREEKTRIGEKQRPRSAAPPGLRTVISVFAIAFLLWAYPAAADDAAGFTLLTASGKERSGPLKSIGENWLVELGGEEAIRAAGTAVISLQRTKAPRPGRPRGSYLVLANGDFLPGRPIELTGEALRFQADLGNETELKLPVSTVSLIWFAAPEGIEYPDRFRRELAAAKRSRDAVYLRNGDVVEGVLNGVDRTKVDMEVDKKDLTVDLSKVAVIAMNTDLVRPPSVAGLHAHLVLANGARLTLTSALASSTTLKGDLAVGGSIKMPLAKVASIDVLKGSTVYLSELKPRSYEYVDFLGSDLKTPYGVDASIWKGDLRIGEAVYDRGIALKARSRLTYDLGGAYRRFEAVVGLDAGNHEKAGAKVDVLVDGKRQALGVGSELTRQGATKKISIDVRGAKELTLVVDFRARVGAIPGEVDWVDARLIRAEK
jgi:hypothetical protein